MPTTVKVPNETPEEKQRREEAERVAKEIVEDTKTKAKTEEVMDARLDESEKQREQRRAQHLADEQVLNDVGRVREISDSLDRDTASYLAKRDNAVRRLRGLAGSPVKAVADAVKAVADRHDLPVTAAGLTQPKSATKPGDFLYPFYN